MKLKYLGVVAAFGLLLAGGCASQVESANQGANQVGQTAGGISRLPNSTMEGAAKGVAGQPSPNPYNR
ncbi:MAG TPA: hypothetical protein VG938_13780 [Verrucomicrobiae bacterium]|jgi:hypothetical protein|nr:hypothetical protein [Verrucomicrobiae bacterium]